MATRLNDSAHPKPNRFTAWATPRAYPQQNARADGHAVKRQQTAQADSFQRVGNAPRIPLGER
ncbi:hypothetical protein K227x_51720 [Rubripirellula lacrimiformis]|uniref:Uncharacterized protein n=1 Tax=Rubripirellula lacrimiformis TaxID=1930273 RepID=A0A517NHY8_9BACT|nr:hypothetical protein K227x_51720 [Rubripirellula lacrimiformis]